MTSAIRLGASALLCTALLASSQPALAQYSQQGAKLVGSTAVAPSWQGNAVAISADGNTAVVGGFLDNGNIGGVWVYTRSGGVWGPAGGTKLVGTGAVGAAHQGTSVAISGDGTTIIVGGYSDDTNAGAAWVFTGSGSTWTQQDTNLGATKLVGTGATGAALQGSAVALSADGNTAIVGGDNDSSSDGAVWVWTRSGGTWTQQGEKLVGTGALGHALQGAAIALSSDGNTAIVGGYNDDIHVGAVWVFTRTGTTWTQQGDKLVGTGGVGTSFIGISVAVSADGNTAIAGGSIDDKNVGATWVFTRTGTTWTQQGEKLVGTGAVGDAMQGTSVSLSADGNTALVGGNADNSKVGAAWVFTRSGVTWSQRGPKMFGGDATEAAYQGSSVALSGDASTALLGGTHDNAQLGAAWVFVPAAPHDFNADGMSDILWRNSDGSMMTWQMAASGAHTEFDFGVVTTAWQIAGTTSLVASTGDVDHDGKSDIFWRHTNGSVALWEMKGGTSYTPVSLGTVATAWQIAGIGDFDGDGHADILWRHTNGSLSIWKMAANGTHTALNFGVIDNAWQVAGIGDLNGDGNADIVWRHTNGTAVIWQMNGGTSHTVLNLGVVATAWQIVGVGDFDNDGNADIFWRNSNGSLVIWKMAATGSHTTLNLGSVATAWQIVSIGDYDGGGRADILWRHTNGSVAIWEMNANGTHTGVNLGTVATAWTIVE